MRSGLTIFVVSLIFSSVSAMAAPVSDAQDYGTGVAKWEAVKHSISKVCNPTLDSYETLTGNKTEYAIIVFHGYTHYPAMMSQYSELFAETGNNVIVPRLARHQTAGNLYDLDHVRWKEWTDEAEATYQAAKHLGRKVIVVGYSLGGLLATRVALMHPEVDSLYIFAPALRMSSMTSLLSEFTGIWSMSLNQVRHDLPVACGSGYFSAWGGMQIEGLMANNETAFGGVYPATAPSSFWRLTMPIFMAVDELDNSVDTKALHEIMQQSPSRLRGYVYFANGNHNMWVRPDTMDLVPKVSYHGARGLPLKEQIMKFYEDSHKPAMAGN